ncbi:hypothetical protein HDU98_007237 [Podochytrium sp. JEL0797]|nr:hypothetical protein HDU98_007237 [Podochytrium sp. JEL0797]
MVSFVCEACQETIKKPKLDQHKQRCYYAQFSCIDCSTTFQGNDYKAHTSCISEAEKYQKSVYKAPKAKGQQQQKQAEAKATPIPVAESKKAENIVAAPKSAPLMAQLSNKKESKESSDDEKPVSKKSKVAESETFDFKKTIKSVLKKNSAGLTVAELRSKVAAKIAKKKDASKEVVAAQFDESVKISINDEGNISFD